MSTQELKKEIQKELETASEESLKEIYDFLKQIKNVDSKEFTLANNLRKILEEDNELLKKLAL